MKQVLAMIVGVLLLLAPLQFIWGFRPVPEYRTGTFDDFATVIAIGATLYGGVLAGIFALWRMEPKLQTRMTGRAIFMAGMVGAMLAILLALLIAFASQWLSTGYLITPGSSLALLPLFPILGGFVSAFIAGGAALIAYALRLSKG